MPEEGAVATSSASTQAAVIPSYNKTRHACAAIPAVRPAAAGPHNRVQGDDAAFAKVRRQDICAPQLTNRVCTQTPQCPCVTPTATACAHAPSSTSALSRNFPPKISFRSATDPAARPQPAPLHARTQHTTSAQALARPPRRLCQHKHKQAHEQARHRCPHPGRPRLEATAGAAAL